MEKKIPMTAPLIVVSGLPRSGTSMMMRILHAGGMPLVTDETRTADEDNPRGYFEDARVKKLKDDSSWLADPSLAGKGVKIISLLLYNLPPGQRYKVIFLERRMEEVLASQKKMMARQGIQPDGIPDEVMDGKFRAHLSGLRGWIEENNDIQWLRVSYHDAVADPRTCVARVAEFLAPLELDLEAMAGAIDPSLYRNRAGADGQA